jgi:putative acetyltransferase
MAERVIDAVETRRADASDAEGMAAAHRDSIRSLGPSCYPPPVVEAWAEGLAPSLYLSAMEAGEVFFIATARVDGEPMIIGFSSEYPLEGTTYGMSVYVRGLAARRGIGSSLLGLAEAHAIERGARSIEVDASLVGVEFYRSQGFVELERGEIQLRSGYPIACVFMRKRLGL